MRRRLPLFITIVLSVLGLAHFYLWLALVDHTAMPAPWSYVVTGVIAALYLSIPTTFIAMRLISRKASGPLMWLTYRWMALGLYILMCSGLSELARLGDVDPRTRALAAIVAAFVITGYGMVHAWRYRVHRIAIPLAKLPRPYTIAHLSDVHVGPTIGKDFISRVVRDVNALSPDAVVITGDLVDGFVPKLGPHVAPLADLRPKDGVYFATGNHEFYWDADAWATFLPTIGVRVLRNERVRLGDAIELAGADDSTGPEDIPHAVAGRDPALPVVLLAHHPSSIVRAAAAGCDLQLSGHQHGGGQMLPFPWIARLFTPWLNGMFEVDGCKMYIHPGTGFWGPPIRVGTTAEIALLELTPA